MVDFKFKKNKMINLIIKIIIPFLIIFYISSWFLYTNYKKNLEYAFYEIGKDYTGHVSLAFEDWIDNQVELVKFIAEDSRIIDACANPNNEKIVLEANKFLLKVKKKYPYYENLPLVSTTGKKIKIKVDGEIKTVTDGFFFTDTVDGMTIGKGGSAFSYIKEIIEGKNYFISEVYPSIWRGNPIFVISVPVKKNGVLVGIAIISPQIKYFAERYINRFMYEETGHLFFMDSRGLIIAHENQKMILNKDKKLKKTIDGVLNKLLNGEKEFKVNFKGINKHYLSKKINIKDDNIMYSWYIGFTQTDEEIFKNSYILLKIIIGVAILFTIILTETIYINLKIYREELDKGNLIKTNKILETKVEERTMRLKKMAVTDGLTKLYNHKYFLDTLDHEIENSKKNGVPLTVAMIDLDFFKNVNDLYGHQTGDKVLIQVAEVIKTSIRDIDLAGRYGGEEFIVLLKNTDLIAGIEAFERLRLAIEGLRFSERKLKVTASLGCYQLKDENTSELVSMIDKLLYKAKKNGRNRVETSLT